jgi:hypothetical protein
VLAGSAGHVRMIHNAKSACAFVESIWREDREPPLRIHERLIDAGGGPRFTGAFYQYVDFDPFAKDVALQGYEEVESGRYIRTGRDRYFYRYPLSRALHMLTTRQHDRWTKGVPRRPFHPSPCEVIMAMAACHFTTPVLRYTDGTRVPDDMAELFIVGAARKLRSVYAIEAVDWTAKSESQKTAESEDAA